MGHRPKACVLQNLIRYMSGAFRSFYLQGGLAMPLSSFAAPLAFGGVVLTAFALLVYPSLQRVAGLKLTCSLGLLIGIPGDLLLPCAALVRSTPILMQVHHLGVKALQHMF